MHSSHSTIRAACIPIKAGVKAGARVLLLSIACIPGLISCGDGRADEHTRAVYEAALAAREQGDRDQALELLGRVVDRAPRWRRGWRSQGELAASMSDWATAIEAERRLLELDPDDAVAAERLALAGLGLGDLEIAREGVEILESNHPEAVSTLYLAARLAFEGGELDAASRLATALLAQQPRTALGHHILAVAAEDRGDLEAAIKSYRRTLEHDAGNLGARDGLATLLERGGWAPEAARHRRLHTLMVEATTGGFRRKPPLERVATFTTLVEEAPFWETAWAEAGRALLEAGSPDRARALLREGRTHHPHSEAIAGMLERCGPLPGRGRTRR